MAEFSAALDFFFCSKVLASWSNWLRFRLQHIGDNVNNMYAEAYRHVNIVLLFGGVK